MDRRLLILIAMLAVLIFQQHLIHTQADSLHRLVADLATSTATMTRANQALHAQGDALDECMKSVYPRLGEPPVKREGERM